MFRRTRCQRLFDNLHHTRVHPNSSRAVPVAAAPLSSSLPPFFNTSCSGLFAATSTLLNKNTRNKHNTIMTGKARGNGRKNIATTKANDHHVASASSDAGNEKDQPPQQHRYATLTSNGSASTTTTKTDPHVDIVQKIFLKMQELWQESQAKANDQGNNNDNDSNTSGTSSSSSPSSTSASRQNWDRLYEIFTDLEAKLEIDKKPASFDADKMSVSAITSSSTVGTQFCFPRVFSSLGLWLEQQQQQSSTTNSDDEKASIVPPPRTADGLETILREECLWLRPDLRNAHGALMFRYWVNASFKKLIKGTIFPIFDVRPAFTISEFAERETFRQGSPSHAIKRINHKFTKVLFPDEKEHSSLIDRSGGFQGKLIESQRPPLNSRKIAIFSSESGKAIGALAAAKYGNSDNVVFFLSAVDPCFNVLKGHTETGYRDSQTLINNLLQRIEKYFENYHLQKEKYKYSGNPFNIVFIIDQIETRPRLFQALVAATGEISFKLHNFFFEHQITSGQFIVMSRIRIIVSGTGSSYVRMGPGSMDDTEMFLFESDDKNRK